MIERLIGALSALDPPPTADEVADAVWLAHQRHRLSAVRPPPERASGAADPPSTSDGGSRSIDTAVGRPEDAAAASHAPSSDTATAAPGRAEEWPVGLYLPPTPYPSTSPPWVPVRSPGVAAIPNALAISRSLRRLRRMESSHSRREEVLDEETTATSIADGGLWLPELYPAPDRWLDLALIVDVASSMIIWQRTIAELRLLLERLGAFRDVRVWTMDTDRGVAPISLHSGSDHVHSAGRHPRELLDPTGRRVFLLVSDCIGAAWASGVTARLLELWARTGTVAIIHPLPQRLWGGCAPEFVPVRLQASQAGLPNAMLRVDARSDDKQGTLGLPVPVMELEARWLAPWASLVAGAPDPVDGMAVFTGSLSRGHGSTAATGSASNGEHDSLPALDRLLRFQATASPAAFDLASCLASAPLTLPVMRLVQRIKRPGSRPALLAEVFLGGLLRRLSPTSPGLHPDDVLYDFHPGVRNLLLTRLRRTEAMRILHEVGDYLSARFGSPRDFRALVAAADAVGIQAAFGLPFAMVAASVLRSMGGRYAELAERLAPGTALEESKQPAGGKTPRRPKGTRHRADTTGTLSDLQPQALDQPHRSGSGYDSGDDSGDDVTSSRLESSAQQDRRSAPQPAVWRGVPPRNPHFTGREELLHALRDQLTGSVTALVPQALHGLGGVGKTQLAIEYAYRYATDYDLICWIAADQPALIRAALAELAQSLEVPPSADISQTMAAVLDALRRGRPFARWLLIFDNADRPDDITPFFPYATGHVLVTSRNPRWSSVADTLEIDVFSRHESIDFLSRRIGRISGDWDRLAEKVGDLPLAVEQAAAWHLQSGMPIDEFLRLFDENLGQLLSEDLPVGYPRSVAATWTVALKALQEQSPAAVQLLELCAFFGSDTIPYSLLWFGRKASLPMPLGRAIRDQIEIRRDIRHISRYALARVDPASNSLQVHRLVQTLLRARLSPELGTAMRNSVHELLAAANPGQPDDTYTWPRHAELVPHIIPSGAIDADTDDVRTLVLDQIRYLYRKGDYESSRELAEIARRQWLERLGPDHVQTLILTRHLATALRALGEIDRARELNEETLERLRRQFGDSHEHSLATANNLGGDLRVAGKFVEAKALDEDTFERHKQVFGEDDPQTLRVANNLGIDLQLLGDFSAAQALDEDTLRRRREVLHFDDTEILSSVRNVARDLFGLGKYAAARAVLEEILPEFRSRLGPQDPQVLSAARIEAMTLRKLGEYDEARALSTHILDSLSLRFGQRHPLTIAAMTGLANDLRMVGELERARELGEAALNRYKKFLGDHPFTHVAASNLAIVLRALNRPAAARELDEGALAGLQRLLGEEHVYTLCCATNMTNDLHLAGQHEAARDQSEVIYERSGRVRGADHPYTLACAVNLAIDLQKAGEEERAQRLGEDTLVRLRIALGEHHPETVSAVAGARAECDIEPPST